MLSCTCWMLHYTRISIQSIYLRFRSYRLRPNQSLSTVQYLFVVDVVFVRSVFCCRLRCHLCGSIYVSRARLLPTWDLIRTDSIPVVTKLARERLLSRIRCELMIVFIQLHHRRLTPPSDEIVQKPFHWSPAHSNRATIAVGASLAGSSSRSSSGRCLTTSYREVGQCFLCCRVQDSIVRLCEQ